MASQAHGQEDGFDSEATTWHLKQNKKEQVKKKS